MHAFRSILLIVTRQKKPEEALQQAFRTVLENRAILHIAFASPNLDLLQNVPFLPRENKIETHLSSQAEEELERLVKLAWNSGIQASSQLITSHPYTVIDSLIKEHNIDLIIKIADSNSVLSRKQLTTHDLELFKQCSIPIWMINKPLDDNKQLEKRVLVAMEMATADNEELAFNRLLLQYGLYLATQEQATLHIASAWGDFQYHGELDILSDAELFAVKEVAKRRCFHKIHELIHEFNLDPDQVSIYLPEGNVCKVMQHIVEEKEIDVVVMGAITTDSGEAQVGETAENLFNYIQCSVFVIKPEEFILAD